jgi:hypothetical protein
MRLDYDLMRKILLSIEEISDRSLNFDSNYLLKAYPDRFKDFDLETVRYHVLQAKDAGLVFPYHEFSDNIIDLTTLGHGFANNIREETKWNKVKEAAKPLQSIALSVLINLAENLANKLLSL